MRPRLLLSGPMGAGKSTVGRLAAARAGVAFVDLDQEIERRAKASVAEVFARDGEAGFRALEGALLDEVLTREEDLVVALGGGALLDRARRRRLLECEFIVTLTASVPNLVARTLGEGRPLLDAATDRGARIASLVAARADVYGEAHARVATDDLEPTAVAALVLAAWAEPRVAVALGARSYVVRLSEDPAEAVAEEARALQPTRAFVVTDTNVALIWLGPLSSALAAAGVAVSTVVLPAGEVHKTLATLGSTLETMVGAGADRRALVVGLGGGVVNDVAGFAAAVLLRGVRWLSVPTTLLAMVDASVGGKTGVDLGLAKNAVGAFHQPSAVIASPRVLASLPARDFRSGLAEVIKTALIGDATLFELLERDAEALLARETSVVREVVRRSLTVKASIVARDEREAGERAVLNFGHTLGHALEALGGFEDLTHGEAVGLGMVAALALGARRGVTAADLFQRTVDLLERFGLPHRLDPLVVARAGPLVGLDKKRAGDSIGFVLVRRAGEAFVTHTGRDALLQELIDAANFAPTSTPSLD